MEQFFPKNESLDTTIKKKPKEDPVGLFLQRFGKVLDVDHAVAGNIDFSYLSPAQRAESMWAVFNNVMKTAHKLKWKQPEEKVDKDEFDELRMGLGVIKNLYEDEEVKKVYLNNYGRHLQENEAINGDLEKFKTLKKTVSNEEDLLDDYARRIFGKRGKTTEMDRLLFKTAKRKLSENRGNLKELLDSNAELRVLNQFEEIRDLSRQAKKEKYMWTSSRREFLEEFEEAALFGDPLLVFGESGTGKTELIKAASLKLTGKIAAETGGKDVRLQDLIAKRDIENKTFYRFGDIGRAATGKATTLDTQRLDDGRIVIDDEFNLLDQSEQTNRLAKIASWTPGRKVMMPVITEEVEIAPNFLYCASVNLASEKYAGGRKDIPLEVMRKFGKKLEVPFMSREEIFDAIQAALMDENGRMRASKDEISPSYTEEKEESRTVVKEGQEIRQNVRIREIKEQEEKDGKMIMSGGFMWRLSGAIDQLNKSMSRQETVLKSKGEAQYLNKVLIDIGKIVKLMENYVLSEDKISLEQFVVNYIRDQFSEMKSFSKEDRELTKEFFAHFDIDLENEKETPLREFEIMTPRDIGLLSPKVKYEKIVSEEPVLLDAVFIDAEGQRVEYRIEKFEKDGREFIPGQIYVNETADGKKHACKFLGVNTENGLLVLVPYKKESEESRKEKTASMDMKTKWKNPETNQEQPIEINLEKILDEQKAFYRDRLNLEINEGEVMSIWNKNYAEIKSEIEKYGYDSIIIVPENLPEEEMMNQKLIETMEENVGGKKKKVAATWQSNNFKEGGAFAGVRNSYSPKCRLVLTHAVQNIEDHSILKATRNKNVMQVTGLDETEINRRIANGEELPVNCEIEIGGQKIKIEAEGESLEDYVIQQRMYFDKTGEHLDAKNSSYARLLKSSSGSRVVGSSWIPGDRRLIVNALAPGHAADALGLRLSRSFS